MKFKYTKHKKMWDYIIKNLEDYVDWAECDDTDYPEDVLIELKEKFLGNENIINDCYACDYVYKEYKSLTDCGKCPLNLGCCIYEDSLYGKLLNAIYECDIDDTIYYATKIRDAEVKDGVEWE